MRDVNQTIVPETLGSDGWTDPQDVLQTIVEPDLPTLGSSLATDPNRNPLADAVDWFMDDTSTDEVTDKGSDDDNGHDESEEDPFTDPFFANDDDLPRLPVATTDEGPPSVSLESAPRPVVVEEPPARRGVAALALAGVVLIGGMGVAALVTAVGVTAVTAGATTVWLSNGAPDVAPTAVVQRAEQAEPVVAEAEPVAAPAVAQEGAADEVQEGEPVEKVAKAEPEPVAAAAKVVDKPAAAPVAKPTPVAAPLDVEGCAVPEEETAGTDGAIEPSEPVEAAAAPVPPVAEDGEGESEGRPPIVKPIEDGTSDAAPLQSVKLLTSPPAARVLVDGQDHGRTPVKLDLTPGDHQVVLEQGGVRSTLQVNVPEDEASRHCFTASQGVFASASCP